MSRPPPGPYVLAGVCDAADGLRTWSRRARNRPTISRAHSRELPLTPPGCPRTAAFAPKVASETCVPQACIASQGCALEFVHGGTQRTSV
jgi:hypothetical protein